MSPYSTSTTLYAMAEVTGHIVWLSLRFSKGEVYLFHCLAEVRCLVVYIIPSRFSFTL